jgi:hypothetical protein
VPAHHATSASASAVTGQPGPPGPSASAAILSTPIWLFTADLTVARADNLSPLSLSSYR